MGLCIRKWGRLNAWYWPRLNQSSKGIPVRTQIAISIGLAQLAWLPGVAVHAAVAESVELLADPKNGFPPHKGLANAILRSAAKNREFLALEMDSMAAKLDRTPFSDALLRAALSDGDAPECAEKLSTLWHKFQQPQPPAYVVLDGPPPEGLVSDAQFPPAWRLTPGASFPRQWLQSGKGMVQDISSQALMAFDWPFEGDSPTRIADLCAAPGGKTTSLALKFPKARIFAVEQNGMRASRMRENLAARGIDANVAEAESVAWLQGGGKPFDLILVDAPCSASGTIRKHPELNWIFNLADLDRLADAQANLLEAAIGRLAPGGLLIYSVCSWFPKEGADHLHRLLNDNPKLVPAPIWPDADGKGRTHVFRPDPLSWNGEGFQGFAVVNRQ
jgi:16S rRNA (cytosine967-C5)-methyltransferase